MIELAETAAERTAAAVGAADVVAVTTRPLSSPLLPFIIDELVTDDPDDGGAITDDDDDDDDRSDPGPPLATVTTAGAAVINPFIPNLTIWLGSSFKFTDNRFESNVLMSLLNVAWPLIPVDSPLMRKTLCPSKQCINWWADTQFAHK